MYTVNAYTIWVKLLFYQTINLKGFCLCFVKVLFAWLLNAALGFTLHAVRATFNKNLFFLSIPIFFIY